MADLIPSNEPIFEASERLEAAAAQETGLCVSGGGYRAMLFHLGSFWRLNESGWLKKLDRISSVSGGSITAAVLGHHWKSLTFDPSGRATNFVDRVVAPVRGLAGKTLDAEAIALGGLLPGNISDFVSRSYKSHLFGDATLQDLPGPGEGPLFILCATSVQSGACVRFTRRALSDYRVGRIDFPKIPLAVAVAASSAFPPVLSPLELDLDSADFVPGSGKDLEATAYRERMVLSDGGVYDNLGLEPLWKQCSRILVSDAGGKTGAEADPAGDWIRHSKRVLDLVDNQVRSLRKRMLLDAFRPPAPRKSGSYWSIRTDVTEYPVADPFAAPLDAVQRLASVATRLKSLPARLQEQLINWGFISCDAGLRGWVDPALPKPAGLPYPGAGLDVGT